MERQSARGLRSIEHTGQSNWKECQQGGVRRRDKIAIDVEPEVGVYDDVDTDRAIGCAPRHDASDCLDAAIGIQGRSQGPCFSTGKCSQKRKFSWGNHSKVE